MLKKRELVECTELFELLSNPTVFPYVRQKATSADEYWFMTKQLMEEEAAGTAVSRTIIDDWNQVIGTISLFDIQEGAGFLGTWIGEPFQGKGYNQRAKHDFLSELFFELDFHTVFLRIRVENIKSQRAAMKLPYVVEANESHPTLLQQINANGNEFKLYQIPRDLFYMVAAQTANEEVVAM
ncbi:alanine acetyltransferase [Lysinibacillus alkalisoli]|uniref:Alanine acetyltransferase n=1 Tax=Lysinibacillus alkalisoli TaxID=1911548 RepID=A0A917FYE9_9BACI|nr:GNAT family N-acetyltransferase [Lysinibacillus alkalisoli]GGG14102.1 alanine acetyltransferase [Lysinibacillus alkalisoli]